MIREGESISVQHVVTEVQYMYECFIYSKKTR
jgi:hypothetical protein